MKKAALKYTPATTAKATGRHRKVKRRSAKIGSGPSQVVLMQMAKLRELMKDWHKDPDASDPEFVKAYDEAVFGTARSSNAEIADQLHALFEEWRKEDKKCPPTEEYIQAYDEAMKDRAIRFRS